jgi:UDP-2-acetamido-2-deoxy-ribo-hexuluronate aminotransferase
MIKFFNVDLQYQQDREVYLDLADRVYSSGQVVNGPYCKLLEESLKQRTGRKHCVLTASGTDALAFVGEFLKSDNNIVLFPEISFPATNNGFFRTFNHWRTTKIYIETDSNGNINFERLDHRLSPLSKDANTIVVWVNLFGHTVNFDDLQLIQDCYPHVLFVEDAAQSFGASWNNTPSGSVGLASCLSFDPTKNLNAFGIGGAVLTDSLVVAKSVDLQRRPHTAEWVNHGYNSQINEVDAAMVWWKLENRFDTWQKRRTAIAEYYLENLKINCVRPQPECTSAWHKFVIKHKQRNIIQSTLKDLGVETKIHYPKTLAGTTNEFTDSCLSLPIYPELTDSQVETVVRLVNYAVKIIS